jgi:hypothetical protein
MQTELFHSIRQQVITSGGSRSYYSVSEQGLFTTLQRKSHVCIPKIGIARPQSQVPHVSVSDLCIPRIGPHIFLQQSRQTDPGNIKIAHRYMNVETRTDAAQFLFLGIFVLNFRPCVFAVHTGYNSFFVNYTQIDSWLRYWIRTLTLKLKF